MATETSCFINKSGITILGKSPTSANHIALPDEEISDVVSGRDHAVLVCQSGRVYVFGNNSHNQCGLDVKKFGKTIDGPVLLSSLSSNIVDVACGDYSSFFLTTTGELFVCGYNDQDQLGLGHCSNCPTPTNVPHSANVKSVSAAGFHSMTLRNDRQVSGSGYNADGNLGLGHREQQTDIKTLVSFPEVCVKVCCGLHFNIVLADSGTVYGAGEVAADRKRDTFNIVPLPSAVFDVACGENHAVLLMADGTVLCFGKNHWGQLGIGCKDDVFHTPVRCALPEHLDVDKVFAKYASSGVVTKDGEVWLWGRAVGGMLGLPHDAILKPTVLNKSPEVVARHLAFGFDYTLLSCGPNPMSARTTILLNSKLTELEKAVVFSLECSVCMKIMSAPIYQCIRGHSLCANCKPHVALCPSCRAP